MQLTAEQLLILKLDGAEVLSTEALQTAEWMKAAGMGVYSPDLAKVVPEYRSKKRRGVDIGQVYSAHKRVEMAMSGLEENYGGTK